LDSACACGLVDHSQVAISDPAAEFLAVAFAFRCARPHGFNLSLPRHLSLLLLLLPIDSICGRSHCLKTPIYNSAVPNGPFVPLSTKNLDLYALLNGRRNLGKRFSTTSAKHASQKVKQLGRRPFCHIFTFFLPLKYQAPIPPLKQEKEPTLRCVAVINSSLVITITASIPFTFSESC